MRLNKVLIETLKKAYKANLAAEGYSKTTMIGRLRVINFYLNWLNNNHLAYLDISYEQLLAYVKLKRQRGNKVNSINRNLRIIGNFYTYLLASQPSDQGLLSIIQSLAGLKLRGGLRYVLYDLLSEEKLAAIYASCPTDSMVQIRNKSIVGMMAYQALHAGDICRIELEDLNLEKATVFIAGTRRSNERSLKLDGNQLFWLQKYLLGVRPGLLKYSDASNKKSHKLFIGENGASGAGNLRGSLSHLYKKLYKAHPELKHIHQVRSSRIRHWLKKDNIRLVQYKVGHRYLSSTQKYLEGDIESLQQQIDRLHPLNDQ